MPKCSAQGHQSAPWAAQSFLEPDGGGPAEFNRRSGFRLAQSLPMLSVTVTIADLFEFEGKLPPAERPDDAAIGAMIQRQFRFLPKPINVEIGKKDATISFNEESPAAKEEAGRLAAKASQRASSLKKAAASWPETIATFRLGIMIPRTILRGIKTSRLSARAMSSPRLFQGRLDHERCRRASTH